MTKEELEKEARINLKRRFGEFFPQLTISYVMGAEPREKRIQALGERCLQLQKDKGNLTDKVKELEAQVEKMKCCANCKHYFCMCENVDDEKQYCDKWELAE